MSKQSQATRAGYWGIPMAKNVVNLDALLKREDFNVMSDKTKGSVRAGPGTNFNLSNLEATQVVFQILRKPDFQRETANWNPGAVAELIKNFLDGELIPAIIMWKSDKGNIFVIDGAHRLSALISWVHDDYGDNQLSTPFFGGDIPGDQKKAAEITRALIKNTVGTYESLKQIANKPEGFDEAKVRRARNIGTTPIECQWVVGDAVHAEASFYRINQGGAVIDETELEIIRARERPDALAARALLRAGTGHKYWSDFSDEVKDKIEGEARAIHNILYQPEINDPIRTLDLPVAGKGYSAETVGVIFNFIHLVTGVTYDTDATEKGKKRPFVPGENDKYKDNDGSGTLGFLAKMKDVAELTSTTTPGSLGLHPAVYSYSATGKFQSTAFLTQVAFILDLQKRDQFFSFTAHRKRFEDFFVRHKYFINQLVSRYGSMMRGVPSMLELYQLVLKHIQDGKADEEILTLLLQEPRFARLAVLPEGAKPRSKFSKESKVVVYMKNALQNANRCAICGARLHINSITVDHNDRREDGGAGSENNGQLAHPYCNTGYKEKLVSLGQWPS